MQLTMCSESSAGESEDREYDSNQHVTDGSSGWWEESERL